MTTLIVDDLAKMLRLPRRRVYELAREGIIPAIHVGKQVRFDEEKVRAWMEAGGNRQTTNHRRTHPKT